MSDLIQSAASRSGALLLATACWLLVLGNAVAEDADLLIVAGQSNAVGYNGVPGELPRDEADQRILFWWRCGDPPPDEHDSTSGGRWTVLQAQPLGNPKRPKQGRQYGNFAQPEGGFGPEIGLARTLYAQEQKPLAVVKAAFSGTGLERDWNPADPGEGGSCYRALVAEVRSAIAAAKAQKGITLRPRALAWVQGESDANADDARRYAQNLGNMLSALRRDLEAPELLALLAVNTRFGGGGNAFMPMIVAQQERLAASDPRSEYVDTSSATIANAAHFDTKGTLEVGRLFAVSLKHLEAKLQPARGILRSSRWGIRSPKAFATA